MDTAFNSQPVNSCDDLMNFILGTKYIPKDIPSLTRLGNNALKKIELYTGRADTRKPVNGHFLLESVCKQYNLADMEELIEFIKALITIRIIQGFLDGQFNFTSISEVNAAKETIIKTIDAFCRGVLNNSERNLLDNLIENKNFGHIGELEKAVIQKQNELLMHLDEQAYPQMES